MSRGLKSPANHCLRNILFRLAIEKSIKFRSTVFVKGIHRWPVNSTQKGPIIYGKRFHAITSTIILATLQWRHNWHDSVSNHQRLYCLLNVSTGADQRKHQNSASLASVMGIHRGPVNSPHKWPVTRKVFHLMTSSWNVWFARRSSLHRQPRCQLSDLIFEKTKHRWYNIKHLWYSEDIVATKKG